MRKGTDPVSREAYDKLASSYSARAPTKPHNAYYERPATLSLLGDVRGVGYSTPPAALAFTPSYWPTALNRGTEMPERDPSAEEVASLPNGCILPPLANRGGEGMVSWLPAPLCRRG